jgi:GNAT superfamily N-acetyltransferase
MMMYTIVEADNRDYRDTLISLWKRNFESVGEGRYQWLYEGNPLGMPSCFFLKDERESAIVGAISLFPRILNIGGQKIKGFICGDLVVDKKHRSLGPAVKLLKSAIQKCEIDHPCILFGIPNQLSEPVLSRAGFKVLDNVNEMTQVLRLYPYILRHINVPAIARITAYSLDPFFRLRPAFLLTKKPKGHVVSLNGHIKDEKAELDHFSHNGYSLIGERHRGFLKWRFMEAPGTQHQIFTLLSENPESPECYIIFHMNGQRAHIADFFANDEATFMALFSSFTGFHMARRTEAISISFTGDAAIFKRLQKLGYSLRSRAQKMFIYTSDRNELVKKIKSGRWYLTSADNDV